MTKLLSCGLIVFNEIGEILIGHQTGKSYWDLPKGLIEEGEAPINCALREAFEEFGISFSKDRLLDLGQRAYYEGKDLHPFAVQSNSKETEIDACRCISSFLQEETRQMVLEVDAFAWGAVADLMGLLTLNMYSLLVDRMLIRDAEHLLMTARKVEYK
jgi:putative (di)nucleoside polyphosphate hydrolase